MTGVAAPAFPHRSSAKAAMPAVGLAICFELENPRFVGLGYSRQGANSSGVIIGHGNELRDGVRQFADLAIMRLNGLNQELDSLV